MKSTVNRGFDLLPGGMLTALRVPGAEEMVIARGQGARIWDTEGREYIDYLLGSGPMVLGHAHPEVVEAVTRRLPLGTTFYAVTEPILELAEVMVGHIPCADKVQFCVSGSEATFYALRIARAATGRDAVLKFEGGFHGSSDYAQMSLTPSGAPAFPTPEPSSAGIPVTLRNEVLVAPFNDLETTARIVEENAHRIAGIIVEPYQRTLAPVPGFLQGLRDLATRHDIVLVFDEVVTGFRFAMGGAQEYYGVKSDLATYGKIIGGGFPLAAVAGAGDLMELAASGHSNAGDFVYFSGTLNGNPVAAVAGLATIKVIERPGAHERLFALGDRMRAGLRTVFAAHDVPAQVLGVGPTFQVMLTATPVTDYRSAKTADAAAMRRIARLLFDRGIYHTGEKAYLSLAHTDEDVDRTIDAFDSALSEGANVSQL